MRDPYFHVHQYQLKTARHWFIVRGAYEIKPTNWFQKLLVWWLRRKGVFHDYNDYTCEVERHDLPKAELVHQIIMAINSIRASECMPHYEPKLVLMDQNTADRLFMTKGIGPYMSFTAQDLNIKSPYGIEGDYKLMNDIQIKVVPWIKGWCVV